MKKVYLPNQLIVDDDILWTNIHNYFAYTESLTTTKMKNQIFLIGRHKMRKGEHMQNVIL